MSNKKAPIPGSAKGTLPLDAKASPEPAGQGGQVLPAPDRPDPANLAAWPAPVVSNGCRHTFSGSVGQKLYFRVAVQRTRVGLGQWSDIVEVTVR